MADSIFRTLATEVNAKLAEILTLENRKVPEFVFGARKPFKESDQPVRLSWSHAHGYFTFTQQPLNEGETAPISAPIGTRVAVAAISIWHTSEESAEHMLDRLWMATRQVPSARVFLWEQAKYRFPSETTGEDLREGVSVIRLDLPCSIPVPSDPTPPDGNEVTVAGHAFRVGIENPAGEDPEESEYDVLRDWES